MNTVVLQADSTVLLPAPDGECVYIGEFLVQATVMVPNGFIVMTPADAVLTAPVMNSVVLQPYSQP